jgi:hypothetical protein
MSCCICSAVNPVFVSVDSVDADEEDDDSITDEPEAGTSFPLDVREFKDSSVLRELLCDARGDTEVERRVLGGIFLLAAADRSWLITCLSTGYYWR